MGLGERDIFSQGRVVSLCLCVCDCKSCPSPLPIKCFDVNTQSSLGYWRWKSQASQPQPPLLPQTRYLRTPAPLPPDPGWRRCLTVGTRDLFGLSWCSRLAAKAISETWTLSGSTTKQRSASGGQDLWVSPPSGDGAGPAGPSRAHTKLLGSVAGERGSRRWGRPPRGGGGSLGGSGGVGGGCLVAMCDGTQASGA